MILYIETFILLKLMSQESILTIIHVIVVSLLSWIHCVIKASIIVVLLDFLELPLCDSWLFQLISSYALLHNFKSRGLKGDDKPKHFYINQKAAMTGKKE